MKLLRWLRRLLFGDSGTDPKVWSTTAPSRSVERTAQPPAPTPPPIRARVVRSGRLPSIATVDELAAAIGLSPGELRWLADPCRTAAVRSPHYRALLLSKRSGGSRVVLAPRVRLKNVQRWILREILAHLPAPPHAHGFLTGRSIRSHASLHVGRKLVVQADLADFFHRFTYLDVRDFFARLGYPREVARTLALLTTAPIGPMLSALARAADVPVPELADALAQGSERRYHPVLPQGAPTSPALANQLFVPVDRRLARLAKRFGATYSRFADDLAFSGGEDLEQGLGSFLQLLRKILTTTGFPPREDKLRVARSGSRQLVTGLVVNEKVSVPAREYRALRAILHNSAREGLASQNRAGHRDFRAHLAGRIAHVAWVSPARGAELSRALAAVR